MSTEVWALVAAIVTMAVMSAAGITYARTRRQTIEDFVSARGSIGGMTAMATMTASLLGAWILFSPAEAATWAGVAALIGYGIGQAAPIVAFTVVGPRMRKLAPNGHSLSEFVWQRYGRAMYLLTLLIIVLYMFTFLAAEMGAIARAVGQVADAPLVLTLVLVGVATLAYTVYGGLRASIFTDNIQFAIIIPLLIAVLIATLAHFGGWTAAFDTVREENAALLDVTQLHGIEFGLTLVIAILAANLFHQGLWQRVYAARTDADIWRGFLSAGAHRCPAHHSLGAVRALGRQQRPGERRPTRFYRALLARVGSVAGLGACRPRGTCADARDEQHGHAPEWHGERLHDGPLPHPRRTWAAPLHPAHHRAPHHPCGCRRFRVRQRALPLPDSGPGMRGGDGARIRGHVEPPPEWNRGLDRGGGRHRYWGTVLPHEEPCRLVDVGWAHERMAHPRVREPTG